MTVRSRSSEWRAWWRADAGSATAEMSLLAPVLIGLLVFVGVVIHRGVDARVRLDDVAHQAARAASMERAPVAADTAAMSTASDALSSAGVVCRSLSVNTTTGDMRAGGTVRVTVSCDVDFGDAVMLGIVSGRRLSASAVEPVDMWRSVATKSDT
jgi:Flp pilus assembly protein TadG